MTKQFDLLTGEQEKAYIAQLGELLMNCYELVEIAENKRQALWIFKSVLSSIARTSNYYQDLIVKCRYIRENGDAQQKLYWSERLLNAKLEKAIDELFFEYGKRYEKQVLEYTSDNLDNLTSDLPTLEEIQTAARKRKVEATKVAEDTAQAALDFALDNA